jgi:SNF2 family DNA or RNA helicase
VIDGLTSSARRKEIQRRFNTDPAKDPLRILLATDAAREGLNFQAHCADLFHFDLPWNPGRIEQRNGRIDRKLQPAPEVRCHYFVLPQRAEDRVLDVLVRKTETIKKELGSLSKDRRRHRASSGRASATRTPIGSPGRSRPRRSTPKGSASPRRSSRPPAIDRRI